MEICDIMLARAKSVFVAALFTTEITFIHDGKKSEEEWDEDDLVEALEDRARVEELPVESEDGKN